MLAGRLHFPIERATTNARMVVIAMVPVTAMPYAAASLDEEPNPTTSATTPMHSVQLMPGR